MKQLKVEIAYLVYQGGLANICQVEKESIYPAERGKTRRILQTDIRQCMIFCMGLAEAGVTIRTAWCKGGGDACDMVWDMKHEASPFHKEQHPITEN
jgi:hypothetical protein